MGAADPGGRLFQTRMLSALSSRVRTHRVKRSRSSRARTRMRGSPTPGYLGTPLASDRSAAEQADRLVKAARLFGATDEEIAEASTMAALTMAGSTFLNAHQVDYDTFRRETLDAVVYARAHTAATTPTSGRTTSAHA